ncbi:MAG: class I SAM-dependent methyltransferase [Candidatus Solibacter usitatus]|nr:class I SAM-dependent methyltransferase [Candidatus Solibacter usitatus]
MTNNADLYIELMKGVVTRSVCPDRYRPLKASILRSRNLPAFAAFKLIEPFLNAFNLRLCLANYNPQVRRAGTDWPADAETMVGMQRISNVEFCVRDVVARGVPGDFIETGVWRGGVCIFVKAMLKALGDTERVVWLADSFEGLPRPDGRFQQDAGDNFYQFKDVLGVSLMEVQTNFERYGLLDNRVRFLKGWFKDTLPTAPIDRLAILRLDGDMYASTWDALQALYWKVSPGGYVIVDDYGAVDACKQAVQDFRSQNGITDPIQRIDDLGVFWRNSSDVAQPACV